jgi:hypothetical protein
MPSLRQMYLAVPIAVLHFGCAALVLASPEDYRSASKLSLNLATLQDRMNQTEAACSALSQSFAYYREALLQETGASEHVAAPSDANANDGMQEIRSRFKCTVAQFS